MFPGSQFQKVRLFSRDLLPSLLEWMPRREALLVLGPRRAGKTSLLKLLAQHLHRQGVQSFYFDLEHPEDRSLVEAGPEAVKRLIGGSGVVLLDEFHLLRDPVQFVKLTVDWHSDLKLVLTGSSSLKIRYRLRESLIGRVVEFHLYPLSFREFLQFRQASQWLRLLPPEEWPPRSEFRIPPPEPLQNLLHEYLLYGGYPEVVLTENPQHKARLLTQFFELYALRDLHDFVRAVDEVALERVLVSVAGTVGSPLNVSQIARDVGVSDKTVRRYLDLLEALFLIHRIPPLAANPRTEIKKQPKIYLLDSGLLSWSLGSFVPLDRRPAVLGLYVETAVALSLLRRWRPTRRVRYWRTKHNVEVDFVWLEGENRWPVEVKYQRDPGWPRGLRAFIRKFQPSRAFVLTRDTLREEELMGTRVQWLPVAWVL